MFHAYFNRGIIINQNARQIWPMRRRRHQAVDYFDWNDAIEHRLRLRDIQLNVMNERNGAPPPYEY